MILHPPDFDEKLKTFEDKDINKDIANILLDQHFININDIEHFKLLEFIMNPIMNKEFIDFLIDFIQKEDKKNNTVVDPIFINFTESKSQVNLIGLLDLLRDHTNIIKDKNKKYIYYQTFKFIFDFYYNSLKNFFELIISNINNMSDDSLVKQLYQSLIKSFGVTLGGTAFVSAFILYVCLLIILNHAAGIDMNAVTYAFGFKSLGILMGGILTILFIIVCFLVLFNIYSSLSIIGLWLFKHYKKLNIKNLYRKLINLIYTTSPLELNEFVNLSRSKEYEIDFLKDIKMN
jgi:hypothetical protein